MSMIRVVILGSGGAVPTKTTWPSCAAVKYGGTFLFDCCEAAQQQIMKYGLSYLKTRAVFLSHLHADHVLGLPGLVQTCNLQGRTEPLLVTGPRGTKKFADALFAVPGFRPRFPLDVVERDDGPVFENDLFTVRAFPVNHTTPAVGYALEEKPRRRFDVPKARKKGVVDHWFTLLQEKGEAVINNKRVTYESVSYLHPGKKIVYSGDTTATPRTAKEAKNADLLLHDACFAHEHKALADEKKHCTAADAARLAKKARVKKLALTHFSNRYDDRTPLLEEARAIFPNAIAAEEGLEILL